jgi:hypothetical protein
MFGELPKLFDRDFAVGFFLPGAALAAAIWGVLSGFGLVPNPPEPKELTEPAIAVAFVWFVSVGLLAFNYPILRLLEGYPKPWRHLLKYRERLWKKRFRWEAEPLLRLQREDVDASKKNIPPPAKPPDFAGRLSNAVDNYPDKEVWVLPTKFGNLFRAMEVYSRVMYGIDEIPFWFRLQAVLPDQFRRQLGEAWAVLNFFVNLAVAGTITALTYLMLAPWAAHPLTHWIPVVGIAISIVMYHLSLGAVKRYGVLVKSAFDLYRGELAKQLGLELPRSAEEEREMWNYASQAAIYRSADHFDLLQRFRPLPDRKL